MATYITMIIATDVNAGSIFEDHDGRKHRAPAMTGSYTLYGYYDANDNLVSTRWQSQ